MGFVPLQFGVPGAIELFLVLSLWILPLVVVAAIIYYLRQIDRKLDRLIELNE